MRGKRRALRILSALTRLLRLAPFATTLTLPSRSWGVREHALSQDGKMTRGAQFSSARLSLVCKRWHAYIRRPKLAKKLWSRLSLRTVTASNALCSNIALTYGACITSVDLSNQRFLSVVAIHSVLTFCTSLRSLSARRCPKLRPPPPPTPPASSTSEPSPSRRPRPRDPVVSSLTQMKAATGARPRPRPLG